MDSFASAFAPPAQSLRPMRPLRPRLRGTGASVALTISIIGHLGLALLATRHFRTASIDPEPRRAPIELLAADFEVLADTDDLPSLPVQTDVPASAARARVKASSAPRVAPAAPAAPEPVSAMSSAPESSGPRFTISVAKVVGNTSTESAGSTLASPAGSSTNEPVASASVDVPAKLRAGNVPSYTAAALAAGIEANVPLEIVVSQSGVVTSARGLVHVGYGLDEAARQSVLGYRFTPASRSGQAVAVRMHWLMRFQLR